MERGIWQSHWRLHLLTHFRKFSAKYLCVGCSQALRCWNNALRFSCLTILKKRSLSESSHPAFSVKDYHEESNFGNFSRRLKSKEDQEKKLEEIRNKLLRVRILEMERQE